MMHAAHRSAARQIGLLYALAIPLAVLVFLAQASFFDHYEGLAVAHRPIEGSDGQDEVLRRFVLEHEDGETSEVVLPVRAFAKAKLPFSQYGAAPIKTPESAVPVQKQRFQLSVRIDGQDWPTLRPAHFILPLLGLLALIFIRNVLMTGNPFEFVVTGGSALPGLRRPPEGQPVNQPKAPRPQKGPPPPRRKKGKGRRR